MQLKNLNKLPESIYPALEKHAKVLFDVLEDKLIGIYVHGSAAMGSFNFKQSDLDYLAIISEPLTPEERQKLAQQFLPLYGEDAPGNGIEMSIVTEKYAGEGYMYPTPYEFHMGTPEQIKYHGKPHMKDERDPDLAAHFTFTKKRGVCIYGKAIDEVFIEVPKQDFLHSIAEDSKESFESVMAGPDSGTCRVPVYAVLNFCRVLGFINHDLITSKREGGEWALQHLPEQYHPVISTALARYRDSNSDDMVDAGLLKEFAQYSQNCICEAI